MRNARWMAVAAAGLALAATGCMGRLIGEGAEAGLGPKGDYWEEKPAAASKETKALAAYQRFELGEVKNVYGRNVPAEFFEKFPVEFARELAGSHLPRQAAGKTAVFRVHILHYEKADMADNVLGPLEQVVARVELLDKDSSQILAWGNAVGRTGKTVGLGVDSKAKGLAKALVKWAGDYYPKKE